MATAFPTPRQLEYQDWECGMFLHFGLRTFHEGFRDFDERKMSVDAFQPSALDCENWAATAKAAGMKYVVLTAKHHDGWANWPTDTTAFGVRQAPWRDGQGDVIAEYFAACRKHGLAVGLYYSPYDADCPVYADPKAYDDYFINQISELLVPYGPLDILWFDGCGSGEHQYDWPRIVSEIRRLQPNLLIFSMGDPDFTWVGNECGLAPWPCWHTRPGVPYAELTQHSGAMGPVWLPAECDVRMRESNWFYSDQDGHTVKSVEELLGLYYYSVGRGCNLLLNFGPDRRGLLPDLDAARLLEFGAEVRRRFGRPSFDLSAFQPVEGGLEYRGEAFLVDHVILQEDLTQGERIRRFAIEVVPTHGGDAIVVYEGHNVGHKAICRFPLVKTRGLRLRFVETAGEVQLRSLTVHDSTAG